MYCFICLKNPNSYEMLSYGTYVMSYLFVSEVFCSIKFQEKSSRKGES